MYKKSLIILTALILTGCETAQEEAQNEQPPIPVLAVTPLIKDIPVYVESIGTLQPSIHIEIRPQVEGTLQEVFVTEGQWMKKNEPLFKIDPISYEIKLQEAQAQLAMDEVELDAANKKLERYRQLAKKDLVPQTEWDELERQAAKAHAVLAMDYARIKAAQLDLEDCTISAPCDGRVGKIDVHPGMLISGGSPASLATLSKMDPLTVEFTVTEQELAKIPKNQIELEIQTLCAPGAEKACTKGAVTFLDNQFDQKTGQLLLRGKVPNPEFNFRPGQSIRVKIPVSIESNVMLIPQKSIRYNDQGTYVYIVDAEKTVVFRQVVLGEEHGNDVVVLEGLDPGEIVITDGHLRATPGLKADVQS